MHPAGTGMKLIINSSGVGWSPSSSAASSRRASVDSDATERSDDSRYGGAAAEPRPPPHSTRAADSLDARRSCLLSIVMPADLTLLEAGDIEELKFAMTPSQCEQAMVVNSLRVCTAEKAITFIGISSEQSQQLIEAAAAKLGLDARPGKPQQIDPNRPHEAWVTSPSQPQPPGLISGVPGGA